MKHLVLLLAFTLQGALGAQSARDPLGELPALLYTVDLTDTSDDMFHVTLETGRPLGAADRYFDFVAFAPGVHSVLNFGRFVLELHAFDDQGEEVPVERIGLNRWEFSDPTRVTRIVYDLEDSFGSEAEGGSVTPYAATGIEHDYIVLNPFGVCGYLEHHLDREVRLKLDLGPGMEDWQVGSALGLDKDGSYHASSYRRLADSPFLLGELSSTAIFVGEIEIEIFVHSRSLELNAEEVMFVAGDMLQAAEKFIGFAPVKRYVFLIDFMDGATMRNNRFGGAGALEHSYCSYYAMPAGGNSLETLAGIISHEFMHILTPLHLRSTIIANFDYSIATTDQQLWLYEGLTEWTADMLQLRGGLLELDEYLNTMIGKMHSSSRYRDDYSLARLSLEWSTPEGLGQYGNIYSLGALTAMVLDLRILELSGGERGLREVFRDLIHKFGEQRPFDDASFLDEFVAASYPEIADFMRAHVQGREALPYQEAFRNVGIAFTPDARGVAGSFKLIESCTKQQRALREAWMKNLDI